jgi:hypothetical protein
VATRAIRFVRVVLHAEMAADLIEIVLRTAKYILSVCEATCKILLK